METLRRIKRALASPPRKNARLFWKYAIWDKLHFRKYKSNKVIMLRLDLLGDCTMFTSAAKAIRELYQGREMTVVCLSSTRNIFERLGLFEKVIGMDFKPHEVDYAKLKTLIATLRADQYDVLLQPQVSKYPLADILGAAIKCNERIAIHTKAGNSPEKWIRKVGFLYDRFIPYPDHLVSEFDYYGAFVRGLGRPDYQTMRPCLPYGPQHFIDRKYYVLYPGGSLSQKFWPSERFARIADHIYHRTGLTGVILGVGSEQWVSDRLIANLGVITQQAMIDLTGKTSVADIIDIIGNAELVVSNDTSGVHIACATNTPSVANVGGWLFGRFLPYHIEDVKPGDHLPLVANAYMPCYHCDWEWSIVGQRNPECLRRLKAGEPSECIWNITYEQIRGLVDQAMEENGLC